MKLHMLAAVLSAAVLVSAPAWSAEWSYRDGSGKTVTLDAPPQRIVAHAIPAAALMSFGIRPVAIFADGLVADDRSLAGLDLTGIEIVGQAWSEINVEKVAALDPDLIVSEWWPRSKTYWGGDPLNQPDSPLPLIAPVIGVTQSDSILGMIEDYAKMAAAFGADLSAPDNAAAKADFESALEAFQGAAAAKPDLTVLAIWAGEDYEVAVPAMASELNDFMHWGLNIITPTDPQGDYWEALSWENADKYQPDLIIVDNRSPSVLAAAAAQPSWTTIKAAAAGQVGEWPAYWVRSYAAYAAELKKLTASIEAADANLVD